MFVDIFLILLGNAKFLFENLQRLSCQAHLACMACTAVCLLVTQTSFHHSGVKLHILSILKENLKVASDCTPWLVKLSSSVK